MIIKQIWKQPVSHDHPELNHTPINQNLLHIKFIDASSVEAIAEMATRMRALEFFNEPYDPPEE